jgi:putative restriction endonuclease
MKAYVGVTDGDWYNLLAAQAGLEEANFWQPGGSRFFRALKPGEMFLFKLHSPLNFIVGGGVFAHSTLLPVSLAWKSFGIANGATSLVDMHSRVAKYRRAQPDEGEDYTIGCILLEQPFFLPREKWIPIPADWKSNIVQGRTYDLEEASGRSIWSALQEALAVSPSSSQVPVVPELPIRYGAPVLIKPRLGQGSFRVLVTDAYQRRCAVTGEKTLPVLEAAHIQSYARGGPHRVDNGVLLRSDLHTLFDRGYMTLTPEYRVQISKRIQEEYGDGCEYYSLHGRPMTLPSAEEGWPAESFLRWHNEKIFRG